MKENKNPDRAADQVQTSIAISRDLMCEIKAIADRESRSRNNAIGWLLKESVAKYKADKKEGFHRPPDCHAPTIHTDAADRTKYPIKRR